MERVTLEWFGPFSVTEDGWADHSVMRETMGVYMFLDSVWDERREIWIGHHLLRVGLTYDQTFAERISQYRSDGKVGKWLIDNTRDNLTVKVSRVGLVDQGKISYPLVADIENLLIAALQPPGNTQGTRTYNGRELTVFNTRKFKPLPPEVSTDNL